MATDTPLTGAALGTSPGQMQRTSLSEQALKVIRQAMIRGEIRPGEIYSAAALASQLGVSNSPVREAMLTLVNEGLMVPVRNRGYQVIASSRSDLEDIHEIRVLLEVPAMGKLARQASQHDFEPFRELAQNNVDAAAAGDLDAYLDTDREFHLGLTRLAGNERLVKMIASLRDHTRLYGLTGLSEQGQLTASAAEHLEILDAIVAGDAPAAKRHMKKHLAHITHEWAGE